MGELKELIQAKHIQGISFRQISEAVGINYHNMYAFSKAYYGRQMPTKDTYRKLKEYFGEEILIEGQPLIYATDSDKAMKFQDKEECLKFKQTLDILEVEERTIIPNYFVGQDERLISLLEMVGIKAKYWYVNDHDGYLEIIRDRVKPEPLPNSKPEDVTPIAEIPNAVPEDRGVIELSKPEDTEEEKYTVADLNGEVIAEYDIKKNKEQEEPKEIFFKPGDIEELAKDERFKPNLIKEAEPDDELSQTVKYLIGLASEKLAKEWHSKQGELNSLRDMNPVEALKIIREKKLL